MKVLRFPVAVTLGFVLTGGVFWFLWALIHVTVARPELVQVTKIEFTRLRRDTDVKTTRDEKVQREKLIEAPAAPQLSRESGARDGTETFAAILSSPSVDTRPDMASSRLALSVGGSDRDVTPLVRINPDYPPVALQRRIEGWVVVQFTITTAGTVRDAKAVQAQPQQVFEDAAVKAVSRWKYNPRIEEGSAVERRGVQVKLMFRLEA
jgi:periplasmic protein TonB